MFFVKMVDKPKQNIYTWLINQTEAVDELKNNRKGAVLMANEKNITTVRDEDKSFIRVIMSLPPEKKNLIQGIIIGLDLQEKQTATAAR